MERHDVVQRLKEHPVRDTLRKPLLGQPVYEHDLAEANLPPKLDKAFRQALEQVKASGSGQEADELSYEIVYAAGPDHETRAEQLRREAAAGDADARAQLDARARAHQEQMDAVLRRTGRKG